MKKRPASALAENEDSELVKQQKLFQKIWNQVKDEPVQWEARGSGQKYVNVQPALPVEVAKMSLNDKVALFREGLPPQMDASDMAKMLLFICTRNEISALYMRFSTARKYADEKAKKAWDALNSQDWRTGVREKKNKNTCEAHC